MCPRTQSISHWFEKYISLQATIEIPRTFTVNKRMITKLILFRQCQSLFDPLFETRAQSLVKEIRSLHKEAFMDVENLVILSYHYGNSLTLEGAPVN